MTTRSTYQNRGRALSNGALMRALKFKEADLAANRAGKLSAAQRERYERPQFSQLADIVIFGHAALLLGILGMLAIVTGETALWLVLLIVGGLSLVPFVMLQNEGNLRPALTSDIQAGKVEQATGTAFVEIKHGRAIYYQLILDGKTFGISTKTYGAFRQGEDYHIYYLPSSMTLLSAEPVTADEAS